MKIILTDEDVGALVDLLMQYDDLVTDPDAFAQATFREVRKSAKEWIKKLRQKTRCTPAMDRLRDAAKMYEDEGVLEFDPDCTVSRAVGNPERGAYVQCWHWITDAEAREFAKPPKSG